MHNHTPYDLLVVGAGIIGLATAYAACQRGLRVAVVERHAHCTGASVRNFGLVCVTGQRRGEHHQRAQRSRALWSTVAAQAGIAIQHTGLHLLAQRPEAAQLLEAFLQTDMGAGCQLLSRAEAARQLPWLQDGQAVLHSPHECRVESRLALPQLARWLAQTQGVDMFWNTAVHGIELPHIHTSQGVLRASHCVVCPGHDMQTLYPQALSAAGMRVCSLQMLRVQPAQPLRLSAAVMSDLSLLRYEGFADLPEAAALKNRLQTEQAEHLAHGIHLIAVQSADGSLVVGDSHVYGPAEVPFALQQRDDLIWSELQRVLRLPGAHISERWTGHYASAAEPVFKQRLAPGVALGVVTSGTGASVAFAFGEELLQLALQ